MKAVGQYEGRATFQAPESVVDVVEGRNRSRQIAGRLNLVTELEGAKDFGLEARPARQEEGWGRRNEQLAIDARRRSHGPGSSRPDGLGGDRLPGQADARLSLEAGVVVVLELRTDRQSNPIVHGEFVLEEEREQLTRQVGRKEGEPRAVLHVVMRQAAAQPPDDVMASTGGEAVTELEIVGIENFAEQRRNRAIGVIEVAPQFEIGSRRESPAPLRERIATTQIDRTGRRLLGRPSIRVSLQ